MNTLRSITFGFSVAALTFAPHIGAQQVERDVSVISESVAGQLEGFSFREGPESKLEFRGTAIALAADGKAEVEFEDGRSRVAVSVRKLPEASSLGPYSTFILWAVTVDGRANNLGSLEVRNGQAKLKTSTPLSQFALIVSAEPHFAVTAPSQAVVLVNLGRKIKGERVMIAGLAERMDYSSLARQSVEQKSKLPPDLIQARYALAIAEGARAGQYAASEYAQATELLKAAEAAQASKKRRDRKTAPRVSREAIQMAEDARKKAVRVSTASLAADTARTEAEAKAQAQAEKELAASKLREGEAAAFAASEAGKKARADLTARLNRVLPTRETSRGIVAEIAGVQFASGAATLNAGAREALARFSGIVGVYPSMKFQVEGHTDSVGSYASNQDLSLRRALTVRDYLISQGVAASSIDVKGLGPDQPVADNTTADGRARNRRVEIVLTGGPISVN
ncbi:MAG: OmpA family protein [Gammaproteobacteria bacterium]|nr:OmpA family protein [Gammaproteobacteria bacterium]